MRVKRYSSRGANLRACGCPLVVAALLVSLVFAALLLAPGFPAIIMRIIGFHPLDDQQAAAVDKVIPAINDAVVASSVTFSIAGIGALDLAPSNLEDVMTGADESGTPIIQLRLVADDMAELCQRYSSYCGESGNPLRHARIHISDGQVVVTGEVYIGLLNRWQALEIFPELSDGPAIRLNRIAIDGIHYSLPSNEFGRVIQQAQTALNRILQGLTAQYDGTSYRLVSLDIDHNRLVATFR